MNFHLLRYPVLRQSVSFCIATLGILFGCRISCTEEDRPSRKVLLKPISHAHRFDFETDEMEGTIRLDGDYHGVTRLVHKRTGRQVIDPRYSALNLFKLMAANQYMGQPRKMERSTKIERDSVEVAWPLTSTHRARLVARYEVFAPNVVDLTVSVISQGTYPGYEVFLPSYFDKELRPHLYLKPTKPASISKQPELVLPKVNDVFRGMLPVFPRDSHAARRCVDGRWDRDENSAPTVPQCPARRYARCLAFQVTPDQKVAAVLMAHPRHCYAISTRYHAENDEDRLVSYSAFDFSLFGDDLVPGATRTVKVRLAITDLDVEMSQPLKLYEAFIAESEREMAAGLR